MITSTLNGRLGNQMFQIATTISAALRNKVSYSIPRQTLNNLFPVYFSHFPFMQLPRKWHSFHERGPRYQEIPYKGGALILHGYFQSYRYFEDYRKELLDAFSLLLNHLPNDPCVSVHIRRGDYLQTYGFSILGMSYYEQAFSYFLRKGFSRFRIFSDDMAWCRKRITDKEYPGCTFEYTAGNLLDEFRMASSCRHHIIANSTISWWWAWLSTHTDKEVIAPDFFYIGQNADMVPPDWIRLPAGNTHCV